ncbi:cell death abnormality protein 1-like [Saccostrea echinata]|uniref:cell death abnormality protein 1-like n=1 Tax=Saccostrea echinata TaxID=191078 RepID=UPI002A7F2613|nr:cell death abnormality protein 1-like [Saccostrea echinata]
MIEKLFMFSIACPPGYFGSYCELPCRYPNYGKGCQMECKCDKRLCDHTTGYEVNTTSDNVENSSLVQKETKIKIMYNSSLITHLSWIEKSCSDGYIGTYCELKCRFPSYGTDCQKYCRCSEEKCSHITGCHVCKDGYFGPDCLSPCRYPSYGADCQKGCLCDRNLCHYVTGCPTTDATDKAGQTPTLSVNDSRVLQNETKMNILYISSNVTGEGAILLVTLVYIMSVPVCIRTIYGEECRMECKCDEEHVIIQQDVGIQMKYMQHLTIQLYCEKKPR